MDSLSTTDIILGILYLTGSIVMCAAAYMLLIRKFKRNKLVAMNVVSLVTSRENVYASKTKFLVVAPQACHVKVDLLDADEKFVQTLVDQDINEEELPFDFDPLNFVSGKYYLYLTTDNTKILRSITITR